jgi:hypothetical protein
MIYQAEWGQNQNSLGYRERIIADLLDNSSMMSNFLE